VNSVCNFFKVIYVLFFRPYTHSKTWIGAISHGAWIPVQSSFKLSTTVPPVWFLSSGHCGQWDTQVFDVWQTNLRCSRKTFSQVHGKGTPHPELVQFR